MLMYIIMYVCGYKGGTLADLDFCAIFAPYVNIKLYIWRVADLLKEVILKNRCFNKQASYYFLLLMIARLWHGPYVQTAVIIL